MRWAPAIALAMLAPLQASLLISCGGGTPSGDGCSPACDSGEVCRYDTCIAQPTPCTSSDGCTGDRYCESSAGECLPWGLGPGGTSDPRCQSEPVPGVFFPGVQCQWSGPPADDAYAAHVNVLATPMVASFGAGAPSIAFTSYNATDYGTPSCSAQEPESYGVIRVIDGRTCEQQATIAEPPVIGAAALAIADLGGDDATPEIVAARSGGGVVAFTRTTAGWRVLWETQPPHLDTPCNWAGPSIHDLDDDGVPEVIFYGAVYDGKTGALIDQSVASIADLTGLGYIPVVADLEGDGVPELITGAQLYSWDARQRTWRPKRGLPAANGKVAVGDFGSFPANGQGDRSRTDGIAETVVVMDGVVHVFTVAGREIFTARFQGTAGALGLGGPPILADFDGDGRLEIGSAGATAYNVFDPDCRDTPNAVTCATMSTTGVLWATPTQGTGSEVTSSSAFDFDGDGRAEVVHGDRCFTRVYDGRTGRVEYSRARTSCTWYENPVIADTDGDGRAELITTSNQNTDRPTMPSLGCASLCPAIDPVFDGITCVDDADCPSQSPTPMSCRRDRPDDVIGRCRCSQDQDCGDGLACREPSDGPVAAGKVCRASHPPSATPGVQILADTVDRWVSARKIWNQHAYSVTNIDEAGQVPRTSSWLRNWTQVGLNNFRQNTPPGDAARLLARPDLTVRSATVACEPAAPLISAEVCNRGSQVAAAGLPVTVHAATTPSRTRCQTQLAEPLPPGSCATVSCAWLGPPGDGVVAADDRGTGLGIARECREGNNSLAIRVSCP